MSEEQNEDIFNIMLSMLGEDTEYYVGISIDDATDSGRYSFYFTYSFFVKSKQSYEMFKHYLFLVLCM